MSRTSFEALLDAGVHFGHLRRKWNPAMAPYIFMERNGIHIIDLYKTMAKMEEAADAMKQIARSGKKILFVATKKQAKEIVAEQVKQINMPYVTERWPGGMLTNFATIRKAVRKMVSIDKHMSSPAFSNMSKKERLNLTRERAKLEKNLGSIADLSRLPAAIFIVDILKEHIALAEARKLNIPTFAIVDTNSDPRLVDFPIPANDDASKSIRLITEVVVKAIEEGLMERKLDRDKRAEEEQENADDLEMRGDMDEGDEIADEAGDEDVTVTQKDFVDNKLGKSRVPGTSSEGDKAKTLRKRISKPAGKPRK
ncbi:MAG TPA: 30S ribosomal protein S2 [Bacteroidales bacterium]|nr:30S ribosomal protein S2 [Bacteroidales bacterium]HPS74645.1 30S ribosomal protein S2 [Bacteroidales bacterium]